MDCFSLSIALKDKQADSEQQDVDNSISWFHTALV